MNKYNYCGDMCSEAYTIVSNLRNQICYCLRNEACLVQIKVKVLNKLYIVVYLNVFSIRGKLKWCGPYITFKNLTYA